MKQIPNQTVSDLIRLIPILIKSIPPGQCTRVLNAIRLLSIIIKRLKITENEN
jgi:hypothetical protein